MTLTPLHLAILSGDKFLVRKLLHELNLKCWSSGYRFISSHPCPASDDSPAVRVSVPTNSLQRSTGNASYIARGHAVAKVNLSRGGREGNNAFTCDSAVSDSDFAHYFEFLMSHGQDHVHLIDVFAQSIDPQRTSYKSAVATTKQVIHINYLQKCF